ncbi:MAG: hypothetical protein ACXVK3_18995 [Candidatus Angelobacter sp.]
MSFAVAYVFSPQTHSTVCDEHRLSAACFQNNFCADTNLFRIKTQILAIWRMRLLPRFFHTCNPQNKETKKQGTKEEICLENIWEAFERTAVTSSILSKLQAGNRTEAVSLGIRKGLIPI